VSLSRWSGISHALNDSSIRPEAVVQLLAG
jgi:hypothetical protein